MSKKSLKTKKAARANGTAKKRVRGGNGKKSPQNLTPHPTPSSVKVKGRAGDNEKSLVKARRLGAQCPLCDTLLQVRSGSLCGRRVVFTANKYGELRALAVSLC